MNYLVFDTETQNTFDEVGSSDPASLSLSVISIFESPSKEVKSFIEPELDLIWPIFEKADFVVGYNSNHFDIPLLNKYYKKMGRGDLSKNIQSVDLMQAIKKNFGRRVKLDDIASATLGKKKSAHGLEAVKWWREGRIDQIKKYCEDDVIITNELFDFVQKFGHFKLLDENGKMIEIKIDMNEWMPSKKTSTQNLF